MPWNYTLYVCLFLHFPECISFVRPHFQSELMDSLANVGPSVSTCAVYTSSAETVNCGHFFFLMLPANSSIHLLPITQLKAERGSWSRSHLTLRDNGLRTEKERKKDLNVCMWLRRHSATVLTCVCVLGKT